MRPYLPAIIATVCLGLSTPLAAQSVAERMRVAAEEYCREDWAAARDKFSELVRQSPSDQEAKVAWFYLGETESQLQQFEAAKAAYQNFLLLAGEHPHRELARFRLAEIAYLTGSSDAVSLCEGFLQAYPKSDRRPEVLGYLGHLRLIRNEPELALLVYAAAIDEASPHPTSPRIRLGHATALIRTGKSEAARGALTELSADTSSGLRSRANLLLALLDFEAGKQSEARTQLESIVDSPEFTPGERAEVQVWLGRIVAERNEPETAVAHYVRALESGLVEPWLSIALYEWAALHIHSGAAAKGWDQLRQWKANPEVLKLDRSTRELVSALEVRLSFEAAQYSETEKLVDQYRSSFPAGSNYRQVLEVAGRTAFARGEFDRGLDYFKELLAHPSNSPDEKASYSCQLASLLVERKDFRAAKQQLALALESQPRIDLRIQLLRLAAATEVAEGNLGAASRLLDEILSDPEVNTVERRRPILQDSIDVTLRLASFEPLRERWSEFLACGDLEAADLTLVQRVGDFAYRQGDWALATNCYRELAREDWDLTRQAAGWSGLAWTSLAEGRSSSARVSFERLLELPVPEAMKAEAYLPLASLLEQDAENAEAIAMYQRAITQADDPGVVALAKFKCALRMQQLGGPAVALEARDMLVDLETHPHDTVPLDQVIYRLAWLDSDSGEQAESERRYSRILNEFPESKLWPDVAYRLARSRLNRNEIDAAAELLQPIDLATLPLELRERLSFLKAQVAAKQGNWSEALVAMGEIAESTEDLELKGASTYWQAEAFFQTAQWNDSIRLFDALLSDTNLRLDPTMLRQATLRKAESLLANDDWAGALQVISLARSESADTQPWADLELLAGRALFAGGRLADAAAAFQLAVESAAGGTETAAQAQWRIGETWLIQERYAEALEAYLETIERYSYPHWRAAALLQAGKCHERLGNLSQALKLYRQLAEEYPASEFASQAKRRIDAVERRARADELIRR